MHFFTWLESIHLGKIGLYLSNLGEFVFMDKLLEVVAIFGPSGGREDAVHIGDGHLEFPRCRMLDLYLEPSEG